MVCDLTARQRLQHREPRLEFARRRELGIEPALQFLATRPDGLERRVLLAQVGDEQQHAAGFVLIPDRAAGEAHRQQCRIAGAERTAGAEALIAEGLAVGETVVVDGQSRLLPGSPIVIRDAAGKS